MNKLPNDPASRIDRRLEEAGERIEELERELEIERMRLVACGVVALANTPDSAKSVRKMSPEYHSGSLDSVVHIVDSEMALRQERDALQAEIAELVAAFSDVEKRLRRTGASIPAPENKGTIESAMATGLSIALILVDEALAKVRKP